MEDSGNSGLFIAPIIFVTLIWPKAEFLQDKIILTLSEFSSCRHNGSGDRLYAQPMNADTWMRRQQLLASLDHQIKSNPQYKNSRHDSGPQRMNHLKKTRIVANYKRPNEAEIYNTQHSATIPLRSFVVDTQQRDPRVNYTAFNRSQQMRPGIDELTTNSSQSVDESRGSNNQTQYLVPQVAKEGGDLLRNRKVVEHGPSKTNLRVRRDDSDDRDDADDEGVWVDDDEDDDGSRQSSDVNETSQDPEDDSVAGQAADSSNGYQPSPISAPGNVATPFQPTGIIGGPHGYEVTPDDYGYPYQG